MAKRRKSTTTVEEQVKAPVTAPAPAAAPPAPDLLWSIALLRVAMELKRPDAPGLEEIIDGVVARMGIPKDEFSRFLETHVGRLVETARERGYAT